MLTPLIGVEKRRGPMERMPRSLNAEGPRSPAILQAARVIEERTGEILDAYVRRLEQEGSLIIIGDGNPRERIEKQARDVLDRAVSVLRGEERSLLAVEEEIYRNIEDSEEPLNPHPDESFRAGVALCKASVAVVVDDLTPGTAPSEIAEVALSVQEIVMDRVSRMVMASFVDYLLTKVKETQGEERRRFSRELHDRLAHEMTVVGQSLDLYRILEQRDPPRALEKLDLAQKTAHEALELMRQFSHELRETETSNGLRIALQNLMRISVPSGVDYEVAFEGEEEHLPDYVRDQLYMVLREGVRNAIAHSGAESVVVEVKISPREVVALVWDHGSGFETSDAVSEGIGLSSMQERTELLGGTFEIVSQQERGTTLKVRLPLMRGKKAKDL